MAGNDRYSLHLVKADATAIQVHNGSFNPNGDARRLAPLASIDPTVSIFMGSAPVYGFSTYEVGVALAAIGIAGLDCSTALELGFVERAQGGAFEAGGEKVAAAKCLVVPDRLTVDQNGLAVISYRAHAYSSDGSTDPLDHTASLPAGTPAIAEAFMIGSVTLNASPLGQVLGFSLDFGIEVQTFKAGGLIYPTKAGIIGRNPSMEIRVANLGELTDTILRGSEITNVVLNLLKLSTTGGGLAGAGNKSITAAKAFVDVSGAEASHPGDAGLTIRALPRKDGATAILAVA